MAAPDPIYMPLVGEGTDVWVPVQADPFGRGFWRVRGPLPQGQLWVFPPGAVVAVASRTFSSGESGLVALESFGAAPPQCDELTEVRFSADGSRRLCIFQRLDGLYQHREDSQSAEQDALPYWREGYPLSGLYGSLNDALQDAPGAFQTDG
jgi:hypothetical protein